LLVPGANAAEFAGCTVRVKVAECCSDPEVAVTVIVDVVGADVFPTRLEDPPQPASAARPQRLTARIISCITRRLLQPKKHSAAAKTDPGKNRLGLPWSAAVEVVVATVRDETILPAAFTVAGEKLQLAPAGRPEQANVTVEVVANPFTGVTVAVSVPLLPAVMVSAAGDVPNVKSAAVPLAVVALACVEAGEFPFESTASTT